MESYTPPITLLIKDGWDAVEYAQSVRGRHARNTKRGNIQRQLDLKVGKQRLNEAMKPLRKYLLQPDEHAFALETVSEALQSERRKLWKMSQKRQRRN